jgi:ribosomal protein L29
MTNPTGSALVEAINQILEKQTQEAQDAKQFQAIRLLGSFAQEHGVPPQTGAVSTLSRLLRKLDSESIRQIRAMSDSLLKKDEQELEAELHALRDQLMPIEARIHQVKTKTAFVATVLRSFSPKFTTIWFRERDDIDVRQAQAQIEQLETIRMKSTEDIVPWARNVADVFEQVVIYRGVDAADLYARPAGTVSDKSSRTYLQAWSAFVERFKEEIWRLAGGSYLGSEAKSSTSKTSRKSEPMSMYAFEPDELPGLDQNVSDMSRENFSMAMAPPADYLKVKSMKSPPRSRTPRDSAATSFVSNKQPSQWIQIFIESKLDSSAQATRKWETQEDFKLSLQKWLDTLPVIWGPAADQFVAKVSVKTATGESDLTLPALTVKDAADRLTKAVKMQLD